MGGAYHRNKARTGSAQPGRAAAPSEAHSPSLSHTQPHTHTAFTHSHTHALSRARARAHEHTHTHTHPGSGREPGALSHHTLTQHLLTHTDALFTHTQVLEANLARALGLLSSPAVGARPARGEEETRKGTR